MKRNHISSFVFIVLTCIMVSAAVFAMNSTQAQAASAKWEKACKAYNTWLSKNQSKYKYKGKNKESYKKTDSFMILDIDKNGVPELIAVHPKLEDSITNGAFERLEGVVYAYTYKSGKVVQLNPSNQLKGILGNIGRKIYENGAYWFGNVRVYRPAGEYASFYQCKKKHLHIVENSTGWTGEYFQNVFTIKKGKMHRCASKYISGQSSLGPYKSYFMNEKRSAAKKYGSFLKKCGKLKKIKVYPNTKTGRKKCFQ